MNDLRKAAEMALKYFEDAHGLEDAEVAIKEALRQALDLQTAIEKGTEAWADVPDATKWVEELRDNTPDCKTHPDAPHGFDRNASHSADRYVCECEGWEPPKREWVGLTKEDFYKKDDETVFVLGMKFAEARLKEKNT
jgi:dienelactone hydrolase